MFSVMDVFCDGVSVVFSVWDVGSGVVRMWEVFSAFDGFA